MTALMGASSFGHIQLIGREVIFNRLSSLAAIILVSGNNMIQEAL
jgi:hypothetical protein